jgi:hypothetical protein
MTYTGWWAAFGGEHARWRNSSNAVCVSAAVFLPLWPNKSAGGFSGGRLSDSRLASRLVRHYFPVPATQPNAGFTRSHFLDCK